MPFRRRTRGRSPRAKRSMEWYSAVTSPTLEPEDPGFITLGAGVGDAFWLIHPEILEIYTDEPTLVRSLINYHVATAEALPGAGYANAALWIGIIEQQGAFSGGSNDPIPALPLDNPFYDWVWLKSINLGRVDPAATVLFAESSSAGGQVFDIRAKRKLRTGYGLAVHYQTAVNNDFDVEFYWHSRHLLMDN